MAYLRWKTIELLEFDGTPFVLQQEFRYNSKRGIPKDEHRLVPLREIISDGEVPEEI